MAAGTESLDAELLKDLRGLDKQSSFDGNDAEYQELSIQLQNTHEAVERNPISLTAVRALGEAHWKCCMQICCALALITRGSVRTLIRSVEETKGAKA